MIRVVVYRDARGVARRLTVKGHAGQGRHGEDIVCAAASALVETLILGLDRVIGQPAQGRADPGDADLVFVQPTPEAQAVIETIAVGLRDLAQTEPRFVSWRETAYPD